MKTILHNAFARESIIRYSITPNKTQTCHWCGTQKPRLYRYGVQKDDKLNGAVSWQDKLFCSISCMRSYFS